MTTNMSSLLSTTTNMSSVALRSMLAMPTRFLNHIRRVDDLLAADIQAQQAAAEQGQNPSPFVVNLPGPWAFLTSGYAIALLAMVGIYCFELDSPSQCSPGPSPQQNSAYRCSPKTLTHSPSHTSLPSCAHATVYISPCDLFIVPSQPHLYPLAFCPPIALYIPPVAFSCPLLYCLTPIQ